MTLDQSLLDKYQHLLRILREMENVIVAFSGGVDSALLARVAYDVLGERSLAVTATSPSLPARELREAVELARVCGFQHQVISTHEMDNPSYTSNPGNRCYFCKSELFSKLEEVSAHMGYRWLAYGENYDDIGDLRPGLAAAVEKGVRAPLKEAGLTKSDIRQLALHLGMPVWDKPAFACLSSRFPHGTEITAERLAQVEAAEDALWEMGFRQYRVRYHGDIARIEVDPADMVLLVNVGEEVTRRVRAAGFRFVAMDLLGYKRGSVNESKPMVLSDDLRVL